jgi:hypothetical protein
MGRSTRVGFMGCVTAAVMTVIGVAAVIIRIVVVIMLLLGPALVELLWRALSLLVRLALCSVRLASAKLIWPRILLMVWCLWSPVVCASSRTRSRQRP